MEDVHTNFTTPLYNGTTFNDELDTFDGIIDGAYDNSSDFMSCPSSYQNYTYLNVSCDTALNFSVPLYGTYKRLLRSLFNATTLMLMRYVRALFYSQSTMLMTQIKWSSLRGYYG
jgi:hypothetical protein